jgi:hypothetical protein
MTHFKDLDNDQKNAFKDLLMRAIDRRVREELDYTNQVFRFLVYDHGAGVALLATFMGAVAAAGSPLAALVSPLWKFFIGCIIAAVIYAPMMAVAGDATNHTVNQAVNFFLNQLPVEDLKGYHFSTFGQAVVRILAMTSLTFFSWGVYQSIQILKLL